MALWRAARSSAPFSWVSPSRCGHGHLTPISQRVRRCQLHEAIAQQDDVGGVDRGALHGGAIDQHTVGRVEVFDVQLAVVLDQPGMATDHGDITGSYPRPGIVR